MPPTIDRFRQETADGVRLTLEIGPDGATIGTRFCLLHHTVLPVAVAFAAWGEVGVFDFAEIRTLIATARRLAKRRKPATPHDLRSATVRKLAMRRMPTPPAAS